MKYLLVLFFIYLPLPLISKDYHILKGFSLQYQYKILQSPELEKFYKKYNYYRQFLPEFEKLSTSTSLHGLSIAYNFFTKVSYLNKTSRLFLQYQAFLSFLLNQKEASFYNSKNNSYCSRQFSIYDSSMGIHCDMGISMYKRLFMSLQLAGAIKNLNFKIEKNSKQDNNFLEDINTEENFNPLKGGNYITKGLSFSVGVAFDYFFNTNWAVRTGISYSLELTGKFKDDHKLKIDESPNNNSKLDIDPRGIISYLGFSYYILSE